MKKLDPKRKVWIVVPHCHGNGGWYGMTVLSSSRGMQLQRALKIHPGDEWGDHMVSDWDCSGRHGAVRICFKPDANKALYYYHAEERRWYTI